MRVCPTETERINPGYAQLIPRGPRLQFRRYPEIRTRLRHFRIQMLQVKDGRDLPVPHALHHLDESRHPRCRFHVPDIGFNGPEHPRWPVRASAAESRLQRPHFDRIGQPRADSVRFYIIDLTRHHTGPAQRFFDHRLLRLEIRRRQARTVAPMIHGRTANHRLDVIAVPQRLRQPFEHHHGATFAAHISVGRGIERLAAPVGSQNPCLRNRDARHRREYQVDPSRNRQRRLAALQALARKVKCYEGRRTTRVQSQTRPV